jgi:hypothetical protein
MVSDCCSNMLNREVWILQFRNMNKGVGITKDEGIDGVGKGERGELG